MTKKEFKEEVNQFYPKNKLRAVKTIKDYTGWGLKESKEYADDNFHKRGNKLPGTWMSENIKL